MSGVRSALDEWSSVEDRGLSVEELAGDVVELGHVIQKAEVLRARKVKSLADRSGDHDLGYSTPSAFLVDQTGVTPLMLGGSSRMATLSSVPLTLFKRGWMGDSPQIRSDICLRPPKPSQTNTPKPKNAWSRSWKGWMRSTLVKPSPIGDRRQKDRENSTR